MSAVSPYSQPSPCAAARAWGNEHRCKVASVNEELLEALEVLMKYCVDDHGQPGVAMARDAIAKARGES